MKPERASERAANRRAAMYVAELGWLDGFPLDDERWQVLGAITPITIDGARIAKSRRTARSALRDRERLAMIVGDVERWWSIVDAKLAWCSAPARPLDLIDRMPPRAARSARVLPPEIQPAIVAASIAWATRPAELARAIAWLVARPAVMRHGLSLAIELANLAITTNEVGVDALIELLEVDAPDPSVCLERLAAAAGRLQSAASKSISRRSINAIELAGTSTPRIGRWLVRLLARSAEYRRRVVELVAVVDLAGALRPWRQWSDEHGARVARVFAFVSDRLVAADSRQLAGVSAALASVRAAVPPYSVEIDDLLLDLGTVARNGRHYLSALRFLARVPTSTPVARARMLQHCARTVGTADDARAAWVWSAIAAELDGGASEAVWSLWADSIDGRWVYIEDVFVTRPSRGQVRRWASIVVRLPGPPTADDASRVAVWMTTAVSDDVIRDTVLGERGYSGSISRELARAAVAISDGTGAELARRAGELMAVPRYPAAIGREVAQLIEHAASAGAGWLVRAWLAAGDVEQMIDAARLAALLLRGQWPPIATPVRAGWIDRYPDALMPALGQLAMGRPRAEDVARRRPATDFADPAALRQEIDALRARAPLAPRLAKRLANLETRLRAPRLPSPRRLARLAAGIARVATVSALERFVASVIAAATTRLARVFGLGSWPGWPLDRPATEIYVSLLGLPERDRALAGRLLRARTGPRPWDLRDEPANQAFIARIRAAGIDTEPWLDDAPMTRRAADGQPVELVLEGDPLEVFAMGAHFETCLAPHGENFFSVVSNAADVNKRVLYARRNGAVVGRCLLAITDEGALVAFHVYSHAQSLGFAGLVTDYVVELAARMHTVVAPRGTVSVVLASRWYDDGSRDLAGQFSALYQIDAATIEPSDVVATVRAALGRELDDLTLPLVIAHIYDRPELVLPLAPYLLRAAIEPRTMVTAAELAFRAGDRALADRLLGDRAGAVELYYPTTEIIAELRPSLVLARLRGDLDGANRAGQQMLVAIALEALHRPAQAAAMYERVLAEESSCAGEARRRLAAINTARSEPSTTASRRASRSPRR